MNAATTFPDPATLDELDLRILDVLQNDSSLTNQQLAQQVHASPPTCFRRVRRLRALGYITREVAILSPEKLGAGLTAIVEITLDAQGAEALDDFESSVIHDPSIQQCYRVSPGPDFILVLRLADMPAYNSLAHRLFTSQKNVRNVRTFFAIQQSKFETRLPLNNRWGQA